MYVWRHVCVKGGYGRRYGFQGPGKQRVKGEWLEEGERIIRIIFQGLEEGQTGQRAGCSKSNKTQVLMYGHENKPAACLSVCFSKHHPSIHPSAWFLGKCFHQTWTSCHMHLFLSFHSLFPLQSLPCVSLCVCCDINPDWLDVFWLRTNGTAVNPPCSSQQYLSSST